GRGCRSRPAARRAPRSGPSGPRSGGPPPADGPAPRAGWWAKSFWLPRFPVRCRGARARAPHLRMTDGGGGAHSAPPPRYPLVTVFVGVSVLTNTGSPSDPTLYRP